MRTIFLFLLIPILSLSQLPLNGELIYISENRKDNYKVKSYSLKYNDSITLFKEILKNDNRQEKDITSENGELTIRMNNINRPESLHLVNYKSKNITSIIALTKNGNDYDVFKIKEKFIINWELTNEEEILGDYLCKKATSYFRGRYYTAWYIESKKQQLAPFKFVGLPGVVVKLTDKTNEVNFQLKSVSSSKSNEDLNILIEQDSNKIYTFNEFFKLDNEYYKERQKIIMERLRSKLPRGATVKEVGYENHGIEIKQDSITL